MSGTPPKSASVAHPHDNGSHLLDRVVARDKEAFGELYDRFFGVLFSVVISIVKSESKAEDVLQETFLKIWRKADTYSSKYGQPVT